MNPETEAEIILTNWFYENNIAVYHNRTIKELGNKIKFTTKGSQKKPDMIIRSQRTNEYYAIEVKTSHNHKDIYDAQKILDYQISYNKKETTYYIDDKEISIAQFLIATKESIMGRLFTNEQPVYPDGEWQKYLQQRKLEPPKEFNISKCFLRQLWSTWRRTRGQEYEPGIGILLSTFLEDDLEPKPKMFTMQYEKREFTKKRWHVTWQEI